MALTLVLVWFVSRGLTKPLIWMRRVAWRLVNHEDERSSGNILLPDDSAMTSSSRGCVPSTEITELVCEFKDMINGFSGEGAARLAQPDIFEIPNQLTWQSEYQQLYSHSSKAIDAKSVRLELVDSETGSGEPSPPPELPAVAGNDNANMDQVQTVPPPPIVLAPSKKNRGHNIVSDFQQKKGLKSQLTARNMQIRRSSLFWWILFLIVFPLILANAAICFIVSSRIVRSMEHFVYEVGVESQELEKTALRSSALLKATQASIAINDIVRDLHIMTRLAGWLFFGGVRRSDGFTHIDEAAQECRLYSSDKVCPVFEDFDRTPCSCAWEDLNLEDDDVCRSIDSSEARYLQEKFFFCQARDADPSTGRREEAFSFAPGFDDSPENTLFWDDIDAVPGASKGSNTSGYETTYDRIRVSSAMSVVEIPLYNQHTSLRSSVEFSGLPTYHSDLESSRKFSASSVAFDADGMMSGYRCV